jgi:hypothetical protein
VAPSTERELFVFYYVEVSIRDKNFQKIVAKYWTNKSETPIMESITDSIPGDEAPPVATL